MEKIYKWLSPPKESINYNAAHAMLDSQSDTCQWFLKGKTFLSGSNSLAFSGSKENVSFLSTFVNLYVTDSLSSWLWESHFKVENSNIFYQMELNLLLTAQQ